MTVQLLASPLQWMSSVFCPRWYAAYCHRVLQFCGCGQHFSGSGGCIASYSRQAFAVQDRNLGTVWHIVHAVVVWFRTIVEQSVWCSCPGLRLAFSQAPVWMRQCVGSLWYSDYIRGRINSTTGVSGQERWTHTSPAVLNVSPGEPIVVGVGPGRHLDP